MGWTEATVEKGLSKLEKAVRMEGIELARVVASSEKGNALYVAYRVEDTVFGIVVIFERHSGKLFSKSMDENAGPYYTEASAKVLNALTEAKSEYAQKWRDSCRARLAAAATAPKLSINDRVSAKVDLNFGPYGVVKTGTVGIVAKKPGSKRVAVNFPGLLALVTLTSIEQA